MTTYQVLMSEELLEQFRQVDARLPAGFRIGASTAYRASMRDGSPAYRRHLVQVEDDAATVELEGQLVTLTFRDNYDASGNWASTIITDRSIDDRVFAGDTEATTVDNPEDFQPDPDDLTREQLAEYAHLPWLAVAETLDEWNHRMHGVLSSHHNAGLFLELLNEAGWHVVRNEPPIELPPPTD